MRPIDNMTKSFQICFVDTSLKNAIDILAKYKQSLVPVVNENDCLIGVLTKNKIIEAISNGYSLTDSIKPFVNFNPIYIHPYSEVFEIRNTMLQHKIGHAPVVNSNKQVVDIFSTTDTLLTYSKLVDSYQSQLQLLFDSLQFGLISVDLNMKITTINPFAREISQINNLSNETKVDLKRIKPIYDMLQFIFTNQKNPPKQKLNINGYSLLIFCSPLYDNNTLIGATIIMEDLTKTDELVNELKITKQWEEKLRILVESAYDAMVLVDEKGLITMANKGFCELFSTTENKLLRKSVSNNFPDLSINEVFERGIPLFGAYKIVNSKQCLVTNIPIINNDELIGVVSKITFRGLKQLHDALNKVSKVENKPTLNGETKYSFQDIIGFSKSIKKVKKEAYAASQSRSTVLLIGESGTGKELFAQGIHTASSLLGSFVKVNCSAIPKDLMESEFFGYTDGAFTGAIKGGKKGKFEFAQNGTLFLDEIGDLPLDLQPKLLRVLQEKEFEPIGGNKTIKINVRIIAATNKNLEEMVKSGEFREDLYYRLNILRLDIPPLRERKEDLPYIIENITERLNHSGFYIKGITTQALNVLMKYNWPGNIRELQNVLERAANLLNRGFIDIPDLPNYILEHQNIDIDYNLVESTLEEKSLPHSMDYKENVMNKERELIIEALKKANGNKTHACKLLGISRTWLYSKIKQYNIVEELILDVDTKLKITYKNNQ